jgi:hypothetical protein
MISLAVAIKHKNITKQINEKTKQLGKNFPKYVQD